MMLSPIQRFGLLGAALLTMTAAPAVAASPWAFPWSNWSPFGIERPKWDGEYLTISSGFAVASYGRGRTYAGPTLGIEAGKMWREGDFVYGVSGAVDYMRPFTVGGNNNGAFAEVSRDFAGTAQAKFGYLTAPNFMLYTAVGVSALNETWRFPQWAGGGTDQRLAVRPHVTAGFEWMVNDRTRLFMEVTASPPVR